MITKRELIELVQHRLAGEARTKYLGKLHPKLIASYIGRAYNSLLVAQFSRRLTSWDGYVKEYKDVEVTQDATTNIYYSTLPANIIMIPRRAGNGVIRIRGMQSTSVEYVPITNGQLQVINGLEVDQIDDVVGYVFKNGRVEYQNMTATIAEDNVCMELIPTFESYDEDDVLSLPTGSDEMLLETVVNFLIGTPDSDNLNNNNTFNQTQNIRR